MNFNFMKNFEISNLEAENKQSIYYSNLSNLSSISNISNISLISDTPLSDNIDPLDLSINSNIASIPSPSHVESKIDPMDPYVYESKYKSKSKSSDASRVSKINIPIESSKEEYMSDESKSKSIKIDSYKNEENPNLCQSKNVYHQGIKNPQGTPAKEDGQGTKGETASPATEEAKGCSLLPDVINLNINEANNVVNREEKHPNDEIVENNLSLNNEDNEDDINDDETNENINNSPNVNNENNEDDIDAEINENINNNENNNITNNDNNSNNVNNTTNLFKNFREASNEDRALIEPSDEKGAFTIATMNSCGLRSKHVTIANAGIRNQLDAIVICETHLAGKQRPFIAHNYTAFFKNRSKFSSACKGGVAIMIENKLAQHTVMVECGDSNSEEYCAVKINAFEPPVLIMGIYGPQSSVKKK